MKQKLSEKKPSYRKSYSSEIRKIRFFSKSWAKYSLVGLLIAKFSNKKKIVTQLDFQMIISSINLRYSKKTEKFIVNSLMLFALPVFFSFPTYHPKTLSIVQTNKFSLTKVCRRNRLSNYISIYKKSFQNFDIFLQNIFWKKEKFSQYELLNILTHFEDPILLEEINDSFLKKKKKLIYDLDRPKRFLDYYFLKKKKKDLDYLWARKQILQNLQNWGESTENLVKSSCFLKKKGNSYISNYLKVHLWKVFTNNYRRWDTVKSKIFTEKNLKYSYSELNDPKSYIILESILSDAIYKFSRYLIYESREYDIRGRKNFFLTKEMKKEINVFDSDPDIDKTVKENFQFVNFDQFYNLYTNNYTFDWIKKMLYLKYEANLKPIFLKQTFFKKSLSSLKNRPNSHPDFPRKSLINNYIINNSFSEQERKKDYDSLFPFFEPSLIDKSIQNTIYNSKKIFTRFSENPKKIDGLEKNIQSDDFEIISWKLRKYHSNFLRNYSLPFDLAYNTLYPNYSFNKEIRYRVKKKSNRLFVEFLNLQSFFFEFKKTFSLISCLESKKDLVITTNELDIAMDQSSKNENPIFLEKILLMLKKDSGMYNNKNKLINNCYSYCNKLLNTSLVSRPLDYINIYENYIFHRHSISWKRLVEKTFVYNLENSKYEKRSFEIYHWLYEIKNLSEKLAPHNFSKKLKLIKIWDSENINKNYHSLKISTNIGNIDVEQDKILPQTLIKSFEFSHGNVNNLVANLFIDEILNDPIIIHLSDIFSTEKSILIDRIRNEKLLPNPNYKSDFTNSLINLKSKISIDCKENDIENTKVIYSRLLKNFLKYNRLSEIGIKKRSLFSERKISQLVQLILKKFLVFEIFNDKFDKTKFLSLYDSNKKTLGQTDSYFPMSSTIFVPEREIHKIETIFTEKNLGVKGISTRILPDLNSTRIGKYYNIIQSESSAENKKINSFIFQSINKIYLSPIFKYSKLRNKLERNILIETDKVYNRSNQIKIFHFFERDISFQTNNYNFWFFTSEWWKYSVRIFLETLLKRFVIISSYLKYSINNHIKLLENNLANFCEKRKNLYTLNSEWISRLFFEYTEENIFNFFWSDFRLINNFNNLHWAILSLLILVFLFYQHYFSIFIGSDSIDLWKYFENIKYLTDMSLAFYFTELSHRDKIQLNKTENSLIYFFGNLKHYTKNIRFYLLTKRKLNNWLITNKSLDLSRRKRNLLVQSLITSTRLREYGFRSYFQPKILNNQLFGYRRNPQEGFSYIRYLGGMFQKDLVNYSLYLADKWIFFASLQKIISSQTLQQTKKFNPRFQKIPMPLQFGLSCSKGILLIGPVETGRSYLIKNLAADCSVPLLGISINKLMYNKPDIITESWMNILIESLRRLNVTLDLAKGMSPCIIWIRNIHQLDVNRSTQNIESDPTFLLGILLKHFHTNSLETRTKNNMVMIGSTHIPKEVDPSLISPDRLDRILNIRLLNTYQRKNQIPILLNKNNLQLNNNLLYSNEFGSRTMGYNIRDLAALTNESSLITLTKNELFVDNNIMKLAFHRQVLGFGHMNNKPNYKQNFKILFYKIGRAIVQNIMIEDSATNPLNISNYLWKRKFYYLSKWYLEPSMNDSIIKESTILVHVLGCLAGIAARDSWSLSEKDSHTSISLDKSVENDLDLAFSILETFFNDFPWLETCETQFPNYRGKNPKLFFTNNFLNIMHGGIFAATNKSLVSTQTDSQSGSLFSRNKIFNKKNFKFTNTAWSPRFWRLSFSRSHLFDWIKRPNDLESFHTSRFLRKKNLEKKDQYTQIMSRKKEQLFYERILPRVRKRNVEELESQFENILLEEQFEILGFFGSSTQYQMEHQLDNKPRLFIGKRIIWDPIDPFSRNRHFVFSRREFFMDEEMLRRLYITYGVRRERERSLSSHRIKRFFICRGYNKDLINKLSVRWWNQFPIDQKQNIYTLKRIDKIGIRLKRPQIFTPVYLYQRWLIENIPEKFSRLDLLIHRDRWIKMNRLLLNDSFIYNIILESYQYLFEFFLSNKILLTRITKKLLNKKWIFQNEIVEIIHDIKNTEFL